MIDDDAPQGVVLSRRNAITLLGLAGAAVLTPSALAACVVRPEQTAGPFFADEMPRRSDIRAGRPGVPLQLTLNVSQLSKGACAPLAGAIVDLWHCDADGEYSDETFLRGYQRTDASGVAKFTTIYPGWYPAAPCTSTSRSAAAATVSRRSSTSTTPSPIASTRVPCMRAAARAACATNATVSIATAAIS